MHAAAVEQLVHLGVLEEEVVDRAGAVERPVQEPVGVGIAAPELDHRVEVALDPAVNVGPPLDVLDGGGEPRAAQLVLDHLGHRQPALVGRRRDDLERGPGGARVLEQLPGLRRVRMVLGKRAHRERPKLRRRRDRAADHAEPELRGSDDRVAVDGVGDRVPHPRVRERRAGRVEREDAEVEAGHLRDDEPTVALGLPDDAAVGDRGHVDAPRPDARQQRGLFGDDAEHHLVHFRQPPLEIAGVLGQAHEVVRDPFGQRERSGAGLGLLKVARAEDRGLLDDRGVPGSQPGEDRGQGVFEMEADRVAIHRRDGVHGIQVGPAGRGGLGVEDPLDREGDVVGGHLLAVMEQHALAEVEDVGPGVRGVPGFRQVADHAQVGVIGDQLVVQEVDPPERGEGGHLVRIQADDLLVDAERQRHLGAGRLRARREGDRGQPGRERQRQSKSQTPPRWHRAPPMSPSPESGRAFCGTGTR